MMGDENEALYIALGLRAGEPRLAILIDALSRSERKGYMMALERVRKEFDRGDWDQYSLDAFIDPVAARAPGEAE